MNKEVMSGTEEEPHGESPDLALMLDAMIPRLLGLRCEVMDGFVKVWPNDVVPDETNWLIGARFTESVDECLNILEGLGAKVDFHCAMDRHWVVLTFAEGEIETNKTDTQAMAAAYATYAALYGKRFGTTKPISKD